ncbi:MAG: hypothetical protein Kow0037_19740 [Calditrichia bacterium]
MSNLGYKLTLLVFFITFLSGFYLRLPLVDNLIRSFVMYLIFSALYLAGLLIFNHLSLEALRRSELDQQNKSQENKNQPSPDVAQ